MKNRKTMVYLCLAIAIILISGFVWIGIMARKVAEELPSSFNAAYNAEKERTYQKRYNSYKSTVEKKYHVSNRVSIYIENLREEQKLEVLKVSDVEFIIEDKRDNPQNITSWLEVPGEGTFVINLKAGEYIIDNERKHVLIRVPYPELTNVVIDYSGVKKLLFKDNDWFNGSYREGEELARRQLNNAELLIKKEFISNQNYYLNAQKAAKTTIETLVKQLNPDVLDLTVEVEFY